MKLEKEIEVIAKEAEELFKKAIITKDDDREIRRIREEFKREAEEAARIVYLEVKKKYLTLERDYLKNK